MPGRHLLLENVTLIFRNFSGAPDRFHPNGCRPNFSILLDAPRAEKLISEGWRCKKLAARDFDEEDKYVMKVNINMDSNNPPYILMISELGKRKLTEDTIASLDYAEIKTADVVVNPYQRNPGDPYSAYLKTMTVEIAEDPLMLKYRNVPDIGENDDEEVPF